MRALLPLLAAVSVSPGRAQTPPPSPNPFADVERVTLANGMRLWVRVLPGAADVSVGVAVPYGWDEDPTGREETAHLLEHVLFSDHRGMSEEEIKDQVESRGGRRNGLTAPDRTFYYVTLPAEHGLFGLSWLARILEPHEMDPAVVDRNRRPLALEIGARPPGIGDRVADWLTPRWLYRPEFWRREFGLRTAAGRDYDRWERLHAIGPGDLADFYERYYAPEAMTLMVAGPVSPDSVVALAEATFGALAARPAPPSYRPLVDPGGADRAVYWSVRPDVRYRRLFKIYEMDADTHVRLLFLARYLERRLTARLRFGETKAVYGVGTTVVQRGPAAYLLLEAPIDPARWAFARDVIDEELRALAEGTTPPERFAADRDALVERLVAENREAEDLVLWVHRALYRPEVHETFPDLAAAFAALEPTDLAPFVRRHLRPDREVVSIVRPHPVPQSVLAAAALVLVILTLRAARRLLVRPIRMRDIRYVARIRMSLLAWAVGATTYAAVGIAAGLALVAAANRIGYALVVPVDVYAYQMAMWAVALAAGLLLLVGYLSLPARKLLVFPDHLRVKHLAYRSRIVPLGRIRRVRLVRLPDLIREPPPARTLPLSLGVTSPALHVDVEGGTGYLVRVRDPRELLDVLAELGVAVEGGRDALATGAGDRDAPPRNAPGSGREKGEGPVRP